jgi:pyrophosphate--fructose-6-phosphate 1-phosphotransferase
MVNKVAMLTAGGFAPCLSAAIGGLIERYTAVAPDVKIIAYRYGYEGLLKGDSIPVTRIVREHAARLNAFGGSPIGNSRVKLTNASDLVKRGLVAEGVDPLQAAADQLTADSVNVLHTIGGDDTNTTAADLAAFLASNGHELTVVGLPKTIDNDIIPVRQSLGALDSRGAGLPFRAERHRRTQLSVTDAHRARGNGPQLRMADRGRGAGVPGMAGFSRLATRDRAHSGDLGRTRRVHSRGRFRSRRGSAAPQAKPWTDRLGPTSSSPRVRAWTRSWPSWNDPVRMFREIRLATSRWKRSNPGAWFGSKFAERLDAHKVMVQKSGYFSRSAAANSRDLALIKSMIDLAVDCALRGEPGLIGHDEERDDELRAIEFDRVRGGKPFDIDAPWFLALLDGIGQPSTQLATTH